jgi:IS5 family transposase
LYVKGEKHRGYCASKREYFFGFKVHAVVTSDGIPVEYTFTAGSAHDLEGMKQLPLNLPRGSELTGDSAYTGYHPEEMMQDGGIRLLAARKANSKHPNDPCVEYLIA